MQVVDICRALYKISTGTPASRGPSATAGFLVIKCAKFKIQIHAKMYLKYISNYKYNKSI